MPRSERPLRRGRLRSLILDTTPLRLDRDYRWLWGGHIVSGMGSQITRLALPYQVYVLTGSTLAIAALSIFQLVPLLLFALGGGSLADAVDRRKLLLVTTVGMALCSVALAAMTLTGDPPLAVLFAIAFVAAALSAVDHPARSSAVPRLVPQERLSSALALNMLNFQIASIVGPALGGVLIATIGLAGAYLVDAASYLAAVIAILALRPIPPLGVVRRPGIAAIREGLAYARARKPIMDTFVIDLIAMAFAMPTALFPILALDVFQVGPTGLGLLASSLALGAFLGAAFSGWIPRVRRVGRAVVVSVFVWGISIVVLGLSAIAATVAGPGPLPFAVALIALAVAGLADVISAVFRNTIVQLATPDSLRGRVISIHTLVVTAGPRIGDIQASIAAAIVGPGLAVLGGGLLCITGVAAMQRFMPALGRHEITVATPEATAPAS